MTEGRKKLVQKTSADGKAHSFLAGSGRRELRPGKEYVHSVYLKKGSQNGWSWTGAFAQT